MQLISKHTFLRINIQCQQWSEEDIERLIHVYHKLGNDWKRIVTEYFPDRNVNQIKCKIQYLKVKGRIHDNNTQSLTLPIATINQQEQDSNNPARAKTVTCEDLWNDKPSQTKKEEGEEEVVFDIFE